MDRAVSRGGLSRRAWMALVVSVLLLVGGALAWLAYRQLASVDRAVDGSRLQLAPVTEGNLVRDASADGRIVSANAPTLFAATAGIVTLRARAGDPVRQDQVLATVDSPELQSRFTQEQSALQSVDVELGRARIVARQTDIRTASATELAAVKLQGARRNLERARQTFEEGLSNKVDYERAQDDVQLAEVELKTARDARGLERETAEFEIRTQQLARQAGVAGRRGRGNGLVLTVLDRGIGMDEETMRKALLPFHSFKKAGSGLGLSLCSEIVEAHGGRLHLARRSEGGIAVSVWLPAHRAVTVAAAPASRVPPP